MFEFKLSSVVLVLMMIFIAKISFDTSRTEKEADTVNYRAAASIDKSYQEHWNKK